MISNAINVIFELFPTAEVAIMLLVNEETNALEVRAIKRRDRHIQVSNSGKYKNSPLSMMNNQNGPIPVVPGVAFIYKLLILFLFF
jgi:hypothetical protein